MKLKAYDWVLMGLLAAVGAGAMLWLTYTEPKTQGDDAGVYSLFYGFLFIAAVFGGFIAPLAAKPKQANFARPRRFLLTAFALILPQPIIAFARFQPDPLIPLGLIVVALICFLGSFLGTSFRVIITGLIEKISKQKSVQPEPGGTRDNLAPLRLIVGCRTSHLTLCAIGVYFINDIHRNACVH